MTSQLYNFVGPVIYCLFILTSIKCTKHFTLLLSFSNIKVRIDFMCIVYFVTDITLNGYQLVHFDFQYHKWNLNFLGKRTKIKARK